MSHFGPAGRILPRWSVRVHPALLPALTAGLCLPGSRVGVRPPFFASGPSFGSPLTVTAGQPRFACTRLVTLPAVETAPLSTQSKPAPGVLARIELRSLKLVAGPAGSRKM